MLGIEEFPGGLLVSRVLRNEVSFLALGLVLGRYMIIANWGIGVGIPLLNPKPYTF